MRLPLAVRIGFVSGRAISGKATWLGFSQRGVAVRNEVRRGLQEGAPAQRRGWIGRWGGPGVDTRAGEPWSNTRRLGEEGS